MKFLKGCALVLIIVILTATLGIIGFSTLFSYAVVESANEVLNATPVPPQVYTVNDIAVTPDATVSIKEWGWQNHNTFFEPNEGCAIYGVKIEYTNTSNSDTYVSSYSFNAYADNMACEPYIWNSDSTLTGVNLSPSRAVSGWIYFNVPMTATSFEIECEIGYNNKVLFKF